MPDPTTSNLDLVIPVRGADVGTWDVPVNFNMSQLDTVLGGVTSIALTNVNVALSAAQYNCGFINLTGVLTGNVVLTFPTKGRSYIINNATTGAFTITGTTGAGTTSVFLSGTSQIYNDATNIKIGDTSVSTAAATATALKIGSVVVQTFIASGTYTPTTGMAYAIIEGVAGGGGGGGSDGIDGSHTIGGSGGGGGGYSLKRVTAADIGASKAVIIGAGGTGGTSVPSNGNAGGDTSVGVLCIAKGGIGGLLGSNVAMKPGAAGGVAGTGDITIPGGSGGAGFWLTTGYTAANQGGNAARGFGAGGTAGAATDFAAGAVTGAAGSNYGGGGGGGLSVLSANNAAGGAGAAGLAVITEYIAG